jgi:hypothetical protein
MSVMRISSGQFPQGKVADFKHLLIESEGNLIPGVKQLKGCKHYWAGIDEITHTLVNVSEWETLEDAQQMDTFQPMLDLAKKAIDMGAQFSRPIPNHTIVWRLS